MSFVNSEQDRSHPDAEVHKTPFDTHSHENEESEHQGDSDETTSQSSVEEHVVDEHGHPSQYVPKDVMHAKGGEHLKDAERLQESGSEDDTFSSEAAEKPGHLAKEEGEEEEDEDEEEEDEEEEDEEDEEEEDEEEEDEDEEEEEGEEEEEDGKVEAEEDEDEESFVESEELLSEKGAESSEGGSEVALVDAVDETEGEDDDDDDDDAEEQEHAEHEEEQDERKLEHAKEKKTTHETLQSASAYNEALSTTTLTKLTTDAATKGDSALYTIITTEPRTDKTSEFEHHMKDEAKKEETPKEPETQPTLTTQVSSSAKTQTKSYTTQVSGASTMKSAPVGSLAAIAGGMTGQRIGSLTQYRASVPLVKPTYVSYTSPQDSTYRVVTSVDYPTSRTVQLPAQPVTAVKPVDTQPQPTTVKPEPVTEHVVPPSVSVAEVPATPLGILDDGASIIDTAQLPIPAEFSSQRLAKGARPAKSKLKAWGCGC